jgi:hypothetical protein
MKLRIRGNSIRLRLSQGEVTGLLAEWAIRESVHFSGSPTNCMAYSLQLSPNASEASASFAQGELVVTLPVALAVQWAISDQTGIEHKQPAGDGMELRIVVEKDFRCLQPRPEEDEVDNFPNPDSTSCDPS